MFQSTAEEAVLMVRQNMHFKSMNASKLNEKQLMFSAVQYLYVQERPKVPDIQTPDQTSSCSQPLLKKCCITLSKPLLLFVASISSLHLRDNTTVIFNKLLYKLLHTELYSRDCLFRQKYKQPYVSFAALHRILLLSVLLYAVTMNCKY